MLLGLLRHPRSGRLLLLRHQLLCARSLLLARARDGLGDLALGLGPRAVYRAVHLGAQQLLRRHALRQHLVVPAATRPRWQRARWPSTATPSAHVSPLSACRTPPARATRPQRLRRQPAVPSARQGSPCGRPATFRAATRDGVAARDGVRCKADGALLVRRLHELAYLLRVLAFELVQPALRALGHLRLRLGERLRSGAAAWEGKRVTLRGWNGMGTQPTKGTPCMPCHAMPLASAGGRRAAARATPHEQGGGRAQRLTRALPWASATWQDLICGGRPTSSLHRSECECECRRK